MHTRLPQLDSWRGISILLVLAAHLLPLGPKVLNLNAASGAAGMAIFFTLSGFLITGFLLKEPSVVDFLSRRVFRIAPLATLFMLTALAVSNSPAEVYLPHLLYYGNLQPFPLTTVTAHLWSVCLEMQFYAGIALVYALLRKRGLIAIPVFMVAVTVLRFVDGEAFSIVTWYRIDEILAGGTLALIYHGEFGDAPRQALRRASPVLLLGLFCVSCHARGGWLNYARPYLAALLVGTTLFERGETFQWRSLAYIAEISFALYVIHPLLVHSWLGSGDTLVKYAKRPLLLLCLLALAHLSTVHFERRWIAWGRLITPRLAPNDPRRPEA